MNPLIESSQALEKALSIFHDINYRAQFISLNAAIEGARMKSKLSTFSIVAAQIAAQAARNDELSKKLEQVISKIKNQALQAVAVRNLEVSTDLIDKLDRNLFERNCDVQAWAGFEQVKNACALSLASGVENEKAAAEARLASQLLSNLVKIYVVYLDSFLINKDGVVVTAAVNSQLRQEVWKKLDWFNSCVNGQVVVTDLHYFEKINAHTVLYCSPVKDDQGNIQGVLANCFNWQFAIEMISSAGLGEAVTALFVNSNAGLIGTTKSNLILKDSLDWLRSGELATKGYCGNSLEHLRNGEAGAIGFSHTKGYNSYAGKNWSSIVIENLGDVSLSTQHKITLSRKNPNEILHASSSIESEKAGQQLQDTMKEIDQLVLEVNANNREVKMLAVNASIQAGLAGSDGEGFSIIANEVANLALKSLSFVQQINSTTSKLRDSVDQSAAVRLLDAARDTMSKIDRNLFERYCDIQAWATFSKFIQLFNSGAHSDADSNVLLESIHKIYEVYHDIYLINLNGKVIGSAINRGLIGHDFSHRDWFRSAANGTVNVTDLYLSETLNIPLMTFSSPVRSDSGEIVGVIASRFNCNFLNDILTAAIIDSASENFLVNSKGKVIASRVPGDIFKRSFENLSLISKGHSEKQGFFEEKLAGESLPNAFGYSVSAGYNTYPGQQWVLLTKRPTLKQTQTKEFSPAEKYKALRQGKLKAA